MITELTLPGGKHTIPLMRKGVLLSLSCFYLTLTFAEAAPRAEWEIVQPTTGERELTLFSRPGKVKVRVGGETRTYSLRDDARLTHAIELRDGWAAAGNLASERGSRLVVVTADGRGLRRLELPPARETALQLRPRLLSRDGELTGIAWVEGPTLVETEIRARDWQGIDWGEEVTVSRKGRGSQAGLATTTLANGAELLLWSAYDGNDDEIRFSVARAGNWSEPRGVGTANRVPDVAPAVTPLRRGALAAWSRQGEDAYEVVLARYRGGKWRELGSLGEGLFPRFVTLDERTFVLFRTAAPKGWRTVELDPSGKVLRRAEVLATESTRPELTLTPHAGVELHWPAREPVRGYWNRP